MSITRTGVFYRWSQPISLEIVLERVSLFGRRLGFRWDWPVGMSDPNFDSNAKLEGGIVVNGFGLRHPQGNRFLFKAPLDWRFAQEFQTYWRIDWFLAGTYPNSRYTFYTSNASDLLIVPRNEGIGWVLWVYVSIEEDIRFGGSESEEARLRLEERYHSLKTLFRLLECDEAIAAGAFDDIPLDGHSNCFFHLQRTGVQVLLERFETEETRAMATDAYDGKLLLPPEALPHILSAAEMKAGGVE